ncbi:hypothetical protein MYP_1705 [Sporocytophaga myxococcoides]|uniref:Uncharacterized protein n=1 Tax=Sporocytophaga myxococcoides TaxID=153721 RepID=A0A098LDG4_9BACT|nr:hypothetical protein MYP_1705 [Sporocytophaga myxococcoides]
MSSTPMSKRSLFLILKLFSIFIKNSLIIANPGISFLFDNKNSSVVSLNLKKTLS